MRWTLKNMQNTSLHLCGLCVILHFNSSIKKESKYLQKSILRKLYLTKKVFPIVLSRKIESEDFSKVSLPTVIVLQ